MSQSEPLPADTPVPLREYLGVLRYRKWSIILITFLVVGSAMALSFVQTPEYESEARVLVTPVSVSPAQTAGAPVNLETQRGLAASVPVAQRVRNALDLTEDPGALLNDLEVEVVVGSEFLVLRYRHPDPLAAQQRTQAFAEEYLEFRRRQALDEILAASQSVQAQIRDLNEELTQITQQIEDTKAESERTSLELQQNNLISRIAVLQQEQSELSPPENLHVGQVVQPAGLPSSPATPNFLLNGALALMVGLALGTGVAFVRERLDDRLRGREDLEPQVGAPVLAMVPRVSSWKKHDQTPLVTLTEPKSAPSEAYRMLRTSALFAASQRELKTILVTSAHPDEGKTVTVANLAVALAQAGKRVVAVSADLRKPRIHRFFGIDNTTGLTTLLAGQPAPPPPVPGGLDSLRVMPSGPVPGNPAELLSSAAMGSLLDDLRESFDFVVVDAPPLLVVGDALAIAPFVDGVLLVADARSTSRGAVAHARRLLAQVDAPVWGAVLNNFDPSKARTYPYYEYYYAYRYEQPQDGHRPSRTQPGQQVSRGRTDHSDGPGP